LKHELVGLFLDYNRVTELNQSETPLSTMLNDSRILEVPNTSYSISCTVLLIITPIVT